MQLVTALSAMLLAATGVLAAPTPDGLISRQRIPFNIALSNTYSCGPNRFSTKFPNNGTACQIVSTPAESAFATTALPEGCTITVFANPTCDSVNTITVPHDTSCFAFGNGLLISSLTVSGTCPGFQQS